MHRLCYSVTFRFLVGRASRSPLLDGLPLRLGGSRGGRVPWSTTLVRTATFPADYKQAGPTLTMQLP